MNSAKNLLSAGWVVLGLAAASTSEAAIEMPAVFGDHMVLQRGMEVPLWGSAKPGETVTATFRDQEKSVTANADDGAWRLTLDVLDLGEASELTVMGSESEAVTFQDVQVGDVWVGSGQSNMAGPVRAYAGKDPTLAAARDGGPYPEIRLFHIGKPGGWQPATAEAIDGFSALHFAFGQALHAELDVPIGLLQGAVGGTPSGLWLSQDAIAGDDALQDEIAEFAGTYDYDAALKRYQEEALPKWEEAVKRIEEKAREAGEPKPRVPRKPQPPVEAGGSMRGGALGGLYERYIRPAVGYGIRGVLWDQGESGTGILGTTQYATMRALIAGWRTEWGQGEFPFLFVQKPSGGGCAFGEGDPVTREADAFSPLPDAPNGGGGEQRWEYVRLMNDTPSSWMVAACDLGGSVHPINKWGYGQRAARVALGAAYANGQVWSGPSYRGHAAEGGGKVRISYDHAGGGLVMPHGDRLQGFELAGADGKFVWADAVIDGDTVVVSSAEVPEPTAVRFAFSKVRSWANLFNAEGLPALVFTAEID